MKYFYSPLHSLLVNAEPLYSWAVYVLFFFCEIVSKELLLSISVAYSVCEFIYEFWADFFLLMN